MTVWVGVRTQRGPLVVDVTTYCALCGCPSSRHRENGDGFVACRTFGCACLHYWPEG